MRNLSVAIVLKIGGVSLNGKMEWGRPKHVMQPGCAGARVLQKRSEGIGAPRGTRRQGRELQGGRRAHSRRTSLGEVRGRSPKAKQADSSACVRSRSAAPYGR